MTKRTLEESTIQKLIHMVELGKRLRAMQSEYFRTRNQKTLRDCLKLETEFDKLLEETEAEIDRATP